VDSTVLASTVPPMWDSNGSAAKDVIHGAGGAAEARRPQPWTAADGGVVVRPFGYVHDDPVLVRVPDRDAWLGNVHAAAERSHEPSFSAVLSLTEDAQPATTHHRPFADARDHDDGAFHAAVDDARTLLARDGDVLVHCKAGVSRSAAVLATAIAATDHRSFRDALDTVRSVRPVATPHPALVESAITYLAATHD
jgi:atypical dual specificity phosphatase